MDLTGTGAASGTTAMPSGAPPAVEPSARSAVWSPLPLARRTGATSLAVVVAAAVVGLAAPGAGAAGPALLVLAGLVGLPHGAVDHLALDWSRGEQGRARLPLLLAYAGAAVVVAALALTAPLPALLVLLVLSALHFAEGEAAFDRLRGGRGLALPALALGTAVVALPLLLRPDPVRPVLVALDPGLPAVLAEVRLPVLVGTGLLVAAGLVVAWRAGERRVLLELAVVVAAALVAPPLLVFAAWFGAWHAPRHLVRLLDLQPDGGARRRSTRLALGAVLPTLGALGLLGALWLTGRGLPAAVLVVLLALTVPHAAVVARLRRPVAAAGGSGRC